MTQSVTHSIGTVSDVAMCIQTLPDKTRSWLAQLIDHARRDHTVRCVVLFGSVARGVLGRGDLDVLMVSDLRVDVGRAPIEVDFRWHQTDKIEGEIEGGNDLLGWCVMFGKPIYEVDEYWTRLRAKWEGRVPLPSLTVSQQRERKAAELLKTMEEIGDRDAIAEQSLTLLTHKARSRLIERGVYPRSRPELAEQLRAMGESVLAKELDDAIHMRVGI